MIRIEHLSKSFDGQSVLDDIDFEVREGEIVAILGESGTGKSVLLKCMMGLIRPDSGEIWIDGDQITKLPERKLLKVREKIGYLFQEAALYDFMDVTENLAFPLREHTALGREAIREKVRKALELVDLAGVEAKFPSELSGGMRKRAGLARAIILDSRVLLCDEPTSGLDPIRSRDISNLIKGVAKKLKCTTVITSHDIRNAFRIADRVVLIQNGKIIASGTQAHMESLKDEFVQSFIR